MYAVFCVWMSIVPSLNVGALVKLVGDSPWIDGTRLRP